jgi:hypothetical protein
MTQQPRKQLDQVRDAMRRACWESVPPILMRQLKAHPFQGGLSVPSAESESATFWSATRTLCGHVQRLK